MSIFNDPAFGDYCTKRVKERRAEKLRGEDGNLKDIAVWRNREGGHSTFGMKGDQAKDPAYYENFDKIKKPCGCSMGKNCEHSKGWRTR